MEKGKPAQYNGTTEQEEKRNVLDQEIDGHFGEVLTVLKDAIDEKFKELETSFEKKFKICITNDIAEKYVETFTKEIKGIKKDVSKVKKLHSKCYNEGKFKEINQNFVDMRKDHADGLGQFMGAIGEIKGNQEGFKEILEDRKELNGKQDKMLDEDAKDIDELQKDVEVLKEKKADKEQINNIQTSITELQTTLTNKEKNEARRWKIITILLSSISIGLVIFQIWKTFKWGM